MTAEQDIAAIADQGENTAADVRQALTSVLERADRGPFSVVLIPDTQRLSASSSWISHFQGLADWIVDNAKERNIELVLHLGDVTHSASETEYERAETPMDTLWNSGIPFVAAMGNHDYDGGSPAGDRSDDTQWNTYFGQSKYTDRDWWDGEFFEEGKSQNLYTRITLGGRPTVVLSLEFYPRSTVLAWAQDVIAAHPTHDVIVVTHSHLNDDGTLTEDGDEHGPNAYNLNDASSGVDIWNALKAYPNVVAIFNGHHINGPEMAHLYGVGDEGNEVFQQFANWQEHDEGGDGRIVIYLVNPYTGWAVRQVYNAANDELESEYEETFRWYQFENENEGGDSGSAKGGEAIIKNPDVSLAVAHDAGKTPSAGEIMVVPANDEAAASAWWLSDLSATTFRINVAEAPSDSAIFHWRYGPAELVSQSGLPRLADLMLHLKADDFDGEENGAEVDEWLDHSGNGNHFTQGTQANRPTVAAEALNGHAAVRFNGSSHHLARGGMVFPAGSEPYTVIAVAKWGSGSGRKVLYSTGNRGSNNQAFWLSKNDTWILQTAWWNNSLNSLTNSLVEDQVHIVASIFTGTGRAAYIDDLSTANASDSATNKNTQPHSSDPTRLGCGVSNPGGSPIDHMNGDVYEFMIWSVALNEDERGIVQAYLEEKWGLDES